MMKIGAGVVVTVAALWSQATDPAAVRERLDAYLAVYEPELSTLVATEQMAAGHPGRPAAIRGGGEAVTKLVAREAKTPALIHGPNGEPLESRVTAWIDSAGRLWRAEARSRYAEISGRQDEPVVRVDFRYDRTLDLLVPFEMRERFTTGTPGLMGTSTAKYTDFRRFQTSARIVPQH